MRKISFSVPGIPVGKERARVARGQMRPYTPKKTVAYEKLVLQCWKLAAPRFVPHTGPVLIRFTAVFPIPPSWPRAAREAAERGLMYHIGTPDCENVQKIAMDSLNPLRVKGVALDPSGYPWHDDAQVMGGGIKRYGSPPRLDITLEFIDQPGGVMTPGEARRENEAVMAEQRAKGFLTGTVRNPRNAKKPKTPTSAQTPLERAIAAADARDASRGRKSGGGQ